MTTLFAFLHHLLAFTVVSALAIELILISQEFTHPTAKRLAVTDAVLGAAAGLLFVVGLCRVFFFEKGADYYFHSHAFMTKLSVFIAVALISIIPTVEFLKWRKPLKAKRFAKEDRRGHRSENRKPKGKGKMIKVISRQTAMKNREAHRRMLDKMGTDQGPG